MSPIRKRIEDETAALLAKELLELSTPWKPRAPMLEYAKAVTYFMSNDKLMAEYNRLLAKEVSE